jgi:hypothetical protein
MNSSLLIEIIYKSAAALWLLPPFKQFHGKYFYFFLLLGLCELFSHCWTLLLGFSCPIICFNYFCLGFLLSLMNIESIKKFKYPIAAGVFIITIPSIFSLDVRFDIGLLVIINLIIFLIFLKQFAWEYAETDKLNFGLVLLILLQLTSIVKFVNVIILFFQAAAYFIITSFFQDIIAIFFAFFKVEDPRLKIKFKSDL